MLKAQEEREEYRRRDYLISLVQITFTSKKRRKEMEESISDSEGFEDIVGELAKRRYTQMLISQAQDRKQKIEREETRKRDRYYRRI